MRVTEVILSRLTLGEGGGTTALTRRHTHTTTQLTSTPVDMYNHMAVRGNVRDRKSSQKGSSQRGFNPWPGDLSHLLHSYISQWLTVPPCWVCSPLTGVNASSRWSSEWLRLLYTGYSSWNNCLYDLDPYGDRDNFRVQSHQHSHSITLISSLKL